MEMWCGAVELCIVLNCHYLRFILITFIFKLFSPVVISFSRVLLSPMYLFSLNHKTRMITDHARVPTSQNKVQEKNSTKMTEMLF